MREAGSPAIDLPDDPVEEAMTDHHLDEVTEMIERARTRKPPSEPPLSDGSAGYLRAS